MFEADKVPLLSNLFEVPLLISRCILTNKKFEEQVVKHYQYSECEEKP